MSLRTPRSGRAPSVVHAVSAWFDLEGLETRRLYAVASPKIGDVLGYIATDFSTRPEAKLSRSVIRNKTYTLATKQPNRSIVQTVGDTVLIKAVANSKGSKKLQVQLASIGATVTSTVGYVMTAAVPVSKLSLVNGLSTLQYADASYAPYTNAGKTDDYGVQAMSADTASKQYAVDGTGVTVGILSDSYNDLGGASAGVASGDLPSSGVNVLKEYTTGTGDDEGRAMAEIVHDVAPGANIAFYSAFNSETDFAAGIIKLAQPTSSGGAGAKVIVDDVGWLDEPFFQDGIVAQAVNTANSTYGAAYFSAAGNSGRQSYESTFRSTSTMTVTGAGTGVFQDFDSTAATNIYQQITIPAGGYVKLAFQWNAPFYSASSNAGGSAAPTNSVGIYLFDSDKTTLLNTATDNRVGGDAYQILAYANNTGAAKTAYIAMKVTAGSAPGYVKYIDYGNTTINQFATNSGTSVGHATATGGRGVGAAAYYQTPAFNVTPAVLESYSSAGGTPIFFNANGTSAATTYRNQPSLVGPDGAATTFFYSIDSTFDGQYHFFGTSAAAPHVAAVAALLLQAKSSLTASQIYSTLETTALDMNTAGFDYDTGYGLVRADTALASVASGSISGVVFRDVNSNNTFDGSDTAVSGQTVFIDSDNNGNIGSGSGTVTNSTATAIPDATATNAGLSRVTSSLVTNYTGRVTGLTVSINASHAFNSDLGFTLITPSGIRIPLITNLGYLNGTGDGTSTNKGQGGTGINLTLSDSATNYVQGYFNPTGTLTGTYKPQTPLSAALNENASGTWQLEVRDYRSGSTGTLNSWSLGVTYAEQQTTTNSSGAYSFTGLSPSAFYGTYRVRTAALSGYTLSLPTTPYDITLGSGATIANDNFAFVSASTPSTVASVVLDDGTVQRSRIRTIDVTVSGTVTTGNIASGAFTLTQTAGSASSPTIYAWGVSVLGVSTPAAGQTKISLGFTGSGLVNGSLADGRYNLLIDGSKITNSTGGLLDAANSGTPGSTRTVSFYKLYGDIDGNATVNFNDFLQFQAAFGTTTSSSTFLPGFDYDNNSTIDFSDFLPFQASFGTTV
ncbi:MAG: proprotein convertase P-domain-containing protein [Tepidisphaeraceae bacterium]